MKLIELNPVFLDAGGDGVYRTDPETKALIPAPKRVGVGVLFDCPCGDLSEDHRCYVPFLNPLDGGKSLERGWQRTGDSFETLTLTPSIKRVGGCGWHGFITAGEVLTC